MAREALGIVGAAAGFIIGGGTPTGAQIGFTVGYAAGGVLFPDKIAAPTPTDAPVQTSRDGVPITIIWGLQYCHGNILQKNPEQIVTTTERQGKGGGPEVESKQRFRTYLIGICEGPVAEITRVWKNSQLVYDARPSPAIPTEESDKFLENTVFYLGGEDQLPDPEIEAHWGTDETPAYRGLCYMAKHDDDLTDTGGAIPQYAFEVNGSRDATITSKPYPIEDFNGLLTTPAPRGHIWSPPLEGLNLTLTPQNGSMAVKIHSTSLTEGLDLTITPQSGSLAVKIQSTSLTEGLDLTITPQNGVLDPRLIQHTYETEGIQPTVTPQNGTLI